MATVPSQLASSSSSSLGREMTRKEPRDTGATNGGTRMGPASFSVRKYVRIERTYFHGSVSLLHA